MSPNGSSALTESPGPHAGKKTVWLTRARAEGWGGAGTTEEGRRGFWAQSCCCLFALVPVGEAEMRVWLLSQGNGGGAAAQPGSGRRPAWSEGSNYE